MIVTAKIGPTFAAELQAAGFIDGVMWTPNSVITNQPFDDDADGVALERLIAAHDPTKPLPAVTVISTVELYRAMTDTEFDLMQRGVASQSARIQGIFQRADTFRSDAPEWPLLVAMANKLFTPERAAELLTARP